MAAHQSHTSSGALITSSDALQSNADPLDPVFRANPEICRLLLGCGTPTDKQLQALRWYSYDRFKRGAGLATSRLLRYPCLFPEEPPLKIVWEEEQLDVIDAAWRQEHWFNLPPQGTKFGKVERKALQRAAAIPWLARRRGSYVPRERGSGASGFYGVTKTPSGRWEVRFEVAGELVYVGTCDGKEDAARLVDIILVVVGEEAPENFPGPFQEWLDAGGHGDAPAELVAAALQRIEDVRVSGSDPDAAAEALDTLAAAEKEIQKARDHPWASEDLSSGELPRGQRDKPRANWTVAQGKFMENVTLEDAPETVYELALVDHNNREVAMAFSPLAFSYTSARLTLWSRKRAAADLLDVTLDETPPPLRKPAERTPAHQRALDVATRWASRAGTANDEVATEYATALAAIARRQLSKNSSGGDGVAKPLRKKQHC